MSACRCHYSEFVIASLTRKLSIVTTVLTVSPKELCLGSFRNSWSEFFPTRHYASELCAIARCPSVRPSQVGVLSKWMNGSSSFLAQLLLSAYHTAC